MSATKSNKHKETERQMIICRPPLGKGDRIAFLSSEFVILAQSSGLPPEILVECVTDAFVAGLDPEQPAFEMPLRLVEARRIEDKS